MSECNKREVNKNCLARPSNENMSEIHARWQKLREGTKGLRQKVWTRKIFLTPNISYFVAILKFVAIYAPFGNFWANKVFFWVKNSVSWARNAILHGGHCKLYLGKFANLLLRAKTTHLSRKK